MGIDNWPWKLSENVPSEVPITLRDLIGRIVRVVPEGHLITQEYIAGRVTIYLDHQGLAKEISVEQGLPGA